MTPYWGSSIQNQIRAAATRGVPHGMVTASRTIARPRNEALSTRALARPRRVAPSVVTTTYTRVTRMAVSVAGDRASQR